MTEWLEDAACRGVDTGVFFPESNAEAARQYQEARVICDQCPHAGPDGACFADAVKYGDVKHGMRAGMSPRQMLREPRWRDRPNPLGRRVFHARRIEGMDDG
jgi:hypothetical protein